MTEAAQELEALLALSPDALLRDHRERLQQRIGDPFEARLTGQLILAGAGELGLRTLRKLKAAGRAPIAILDNRPEMRGREIDGVPVMNPAEAAQRHPRAAYVVTTYNTSALWKQLEDLGCRTVISYGLLFAGLFDTFLPDLCLAHPSGLLNNAGGVRKGFALFSDEASRREYVAQLKARLLLSFDQRPEAVPPERRREEYFPDDLYQPLADEVLVDAGAFDGDTIRRFLQRRGNAFSAIHALEPDPKSHARLQAAVGYLGTKVHTYQLAAADRRGTLAFDAGGSVCSGSGAGGGTTVVECAPLDELLSGHHPTLIKMDLEGGEPQALAGARGIIGRDGPVLAVTVYHRQDHLWSLPLLIDSLRPGYRFFLRAHAEACWDACCYAVPAERAAGAAA